MNSRKNFAHPWLEGLQVAHKSPFDVTRNSWHAAHLLPPINVNIARLLVCLTVQALLASCRAGTCPRGATISLAVVASNVNIARLLVCLAVQALLASCRGESCPRGATISLARFVIHANIARLLVC
jgi:hypothetical protein